MFTFNHKNWEAGLQSVFVGKQYIDNTGNDERSLNAYFVSNLRVGYNFRIKTLKSLKLNMLINNLFDHKYESNAWVYSYYQQPDAGNPHKDRYADFGYFPQAGANVLLNINITF